MDTSGLLAQLSADGPRLARSAAASGWTAGVPGCSWSVEELVRHVGGVHRWAADIVATASPTLATAAGGDVGTGPDGDDLLDWFHAGHATLVEVLRQAPADLDCATFLPAESPRQFWARRQAHETAIHRLDAGDLTPFDVAFAQDGIGEIVTGFGGRPRRRVDRFATLGLDASDGPSWLIRFSEGRVDGGVGETGAVDATVRGSSSDLYRWLWNRPAEVVVEGDETVAALWGTAVRVTWS